jgi:hypothetical protein
MKVLHVLPMKTSLYAANFQAHSFLFSRLRGVRQMRDIHEYISMHRAGERFIRLLHTFPWMRRSRPEGKTARENILNLGDHLKRDAGLDQILDDR